LGKKLPNDPVLLRAKTQHKEEFFGKRRPSTGEDNKESEKSKKDRRKKFLGAWEPTKGITF